MLLSAQSDTSTSFLEGASDTGLGPTTPVDAQRLLWKHHIEYEHLYGLSACTENVEYSLHIPEDIERHSIPDNYWCYMYERQVKFYKQQSTNMRSLCKTFADRAAQLHFTKSYLETHCNEPEESKFDILTISQKPVLLQAKSHEEGVQLKEYIGKHNLSPDVSFAYENGIMLGAPRFIILSDRQLRDIKHWVSTSIQTKNSQKTYQVHVANTYLRILKSSDYDLGTVFRRDEYVIISDYNESQEWVMQISDFLVYEPIFYKYYYFSDGSYFVAKTSHGEVVTDSWTKQPWLVRREFMHLRVQPMNSKLLCRKVMLYPDTRNNHQFLVIDPDGPVQVQHLNIPVYPKIDEVVKFGSNYQYMLVTEANGNTIRGFKLRKIRGRNPRWVQELPIEVHPRDIVSTVQYL